MIAKMKEHAAQLREAGEAAQAMNLDQLVGILEQVRKQIEKVAALEQTHGVAPQVRSPSLSRHIYAQSLPNRCVKSCGTQFTMPTDRLPCFASVCAPPELSLEPPDSHKNQHHPHKQHQ